MLLRSNDDALVDLRGLEGLRELTQLSLGSDAERPALASLSGLDTLVTVETLDLAGFPLLRNFVGLAALRQVLPALPGPVPTRSRSNKCRPRTLALACASSPEPQVYALFPQRGSASPSQPWQIQLRRPGLPSYLDRPQIVWRTVVGTRGQHREALMVAVLAVGWIDVGIVAMRAFDAGLQIVDDHVRRDAAEERPHALVRRNEDGSFWVQANSPNAYELNGNTPQNRCVFLHSPVARSTMEMPSQQSICVCSPGLCSSRTVAAIGRGTLASSRRRKLA
jgi:hypothetical protein